MSAFLVSKRHFRECAERDEVKIRSLCSGLRKAGGGDEIENPRAGARIFPRLRSDFAGAPPRTPSAFDRTRLRSLHPAPAAFRHPPFGGSQKAGGGDEIRTHDGVSPIHAFQASALNHSATPPPGSGRFRGREHSRAPRPRQASHPSGKTVIFQP